MLRVEAGATDPLYLVVRSNNDGAFSAWKVPLNSAVAIRLAPGSAVLARSPGSTGSVGCMPTASSDPLPEPAPDHETASGCRHRVRTLSSPAKDAADPSAVTLSTHLSLKHFDRFAAQAEQWGGPVAVSILLRDDDPAAAAIPHLERAIDELAVSVGAPISATLVMQSGPPGCAYPRALLSQSALGLVRTRRVLQSDVHVWFPEEKYAAHVAAEVAAAATPGTDAAYVVPAFQLRHAPSVAASKQAAVNMLMSGHMQPLLFDISAAAHYATDYYAWMNGMIQYGCASCLRCAVADEAYVVEYAERYEPMLVALTDIAAKWSKRDESGDLADLGETGAARFTEWLAQRGATLCVLPNSFTIRLKMTDTPSGVSGFPSPLVELARELAWLSRNESVRE